MPEPTTVGVTVLLVNGSCGEVTFPASGVLLDDAREAINLVEMVLSEQDLPSGGVTAITIDWDVPTDAKEEQ